MELTKQVSSLELSKKLEKLGCKQESLFWWIDIKFKPYVVYFTGLSGSIDKVSAFTTSELGELLPYRITKEECFFYFEIGQSKPNDKFYPKWEVNYSNEENCGCLERDKNLANTMAKMLIYLLENNLINL